MKLMMFHDPVKMIPVQTNKLLQNILEIKPCKWWTDDFFLTTSMNFFILHSICLHTFFSPLFLHFLDLRQSFHSDQKNHKNLSLNQKNHKNNKLYTFSFIIFFSRHLLSQKKLIDFFILHILLSQKKIFHLAYILSTTYTIHLLLYILLDINKKDIQQQQEILKYIQLCSYMFFNFIIRITTITRLFAIFFYFLLKSCTNN